jgi:hypothetical protein
MRQAVPSATERKFVANQTRGPGDATTSRGMAPKDELRRIHHDTPVSDRRAGVLACPNERNAMALATVEVPAALVRPLRETLVLLYQATVEALHLALRASGERGRPLSEVHGHRARLAQLDAMLERLGWPDGPADEGLALSAPEEILHDALYGALIDAGERLATACSRSWRGEAGAEDVRLAAEEVIALDRLLRALRG